jgi:hypothetical protein
MHSYICTVAPHLGTLAETREGLDVEPNQKMMFGGSIPRKNWKVLGGEVFVKRVSPDIL